MHNNTYHYQYSMSVSIFRLWAAAAMVEEAVCISLFLKGYVHSRCRRFQVMRYLRAFDQERQNESKGGGKLFAFGLECCLGDGF